jgi:hypothetical protein
MTVQDAWQTRELRKLVDGLDAGHVAQGDRNVFARFDPKRCDRRETNGSGPGGHQPQPARPAAVNHPLFEE